MAEDDPATTPTVEASGPGAAAARKTRTGSTTAGAADTDAATPPGAQALDRLEPETRLGRYIVGERLGAGGMGEVYAAYDPGLDRRIAVKLLHRDLGEHAADRLRREARTMARLSHRNLVAVHDVGEHDGRLFLAMELIEGSTLRGWARERPWREILRAYLDAGRGLAAAHDAGVIHRDFKPDNVLIGKDGRVAVTDFGIARRREHFVEDAKPAARAMFEPALTVTGAMIGTPLYMSPEQLDGGAADARSDQFAFAVALWESLHGAHPLVAPGSDLEELREAMRRGDALVPPPGPVPVRIDKALVRALAPDPAARWPSLRALFDEIDVLRPRRRTLAIAAASAVVAGTAAAAIVYGTQAGRPAVDPGAVCGAGEMQFDAVWSPAREAALRAGMTGTKLVYAPAAMDGVVAEIGTWRRTWLDARGRACRATAVFHEQSAEDGERRMRCFAGQLEALDATLGQLQRPDAKAIENARSAIVRLDDPARCELDKVTTLSDPELAPPAAALARGAERVTAEVEATLNLGRYPAAAALSAIARSLAAAAGSPRLEARASYFGATAVINLNDTAGGIVLHDRARRLADVAGEDVLRARATVDRAATEYNLGRYDASLAFLDEADAIVSRTGDLPELRARNLGLRGLIEVELQRHDDALAHGQAAVKMLEGRGKPEDTALAMEVARHAMALQAARRFSDTEAALRRAIGILETLHGADHPQIAKLLVTLGGVLIQAERPADAVPVLERSIRIRAAFLGEDHPSLAGGMQNLGTAYRLVGRLEDAERLVTKALAIARARPESAYMITASLSSLGTLAYMRGHPEQSIPYYEEALAGLVARGKGGEVSTGDLRFRLGRALWVTGRDRRRGMALVREARAIFAGNSTATKYMHDVDAWIAAPGTAKTPNFE